MEFNDEYSYDQYHWCPNVLIVMLGFFVSSIKYNVFKDGTAMNTSIRAGSTVQIVSISCPSMVNLLKDLLNNIETTIYKVKMVISIKITIA